MNWQRWFAHNSASAPRVTVRSPLPWPVRLLLGFLLMAVAAAAGVAIYEFGRNIGGPGRRELLTELDRLQGQLREANAERDRNAMQVAMLESQLKVQKAAQDQLMLQVNGLEAEQARLQEDLSFFESLLPTSKSDKGVVIRSFRVQPDPETSQLHYRLLVQQSGKPEKDFAGSVQLRVNFVLNGRGFVLQVPDPATADAPQAMRLAFRHYQRVEGGFALPAGAVAHSVQVRIMAGGQTQMQQTFNL